MFSFESIFIYKLSLKYYEMHTVPNPQKVTFSWIRFFYFIGLTAFSVLNGNIFLFDVTDG